MEYKGFDFLRRLSFVRTAGSKEENKAYKDCDEDSSCGRA